MPFKRSQPATDYEVIDRWENGVGWLAHPEETMERASHAFEADGKVWVVDPVDTEGLDDLLAELGDVVGVVVLLNRHYRDAESVARRYDTPVYIPSWFDRVDDMSVTVRRFDDILPDTSYRVLEIADSFGWEEAALYDDESGTLVLGDALGTVSYFTAGDERLGVHPVMRLTPPRALRGLRPRRILVGHGRGVFDDADVALTDALDGSRRRTPKLLVETFKFLLRT